LKTFKTFKTFKTKVKFKTTGRLALPPGDCPRHSFGRSRANPPDGTACFPFVAEVKS
jgi:hypothetical protein